jgi:hypothetical protein
VFDSEILVMNGDHECAANALWATLSPGFLMGTRSGSLGTRGQGPEWEESGEGVPWVKLARVTQDVFGAQHVTYLGMTLARGWAAADGWRLLRRRRVRTPSPLPSTSTDG